MEFPCLLYKVPGPHGHAPGYKYIGCADEEAFEDLSAQGWAPSLDEAQGKEKAEAIIEKAEELEAAIDEMSPPTRDELEAKAKELGVSFNARTKDDTLAKRISEAL
jgi:hypothetical protein